MCRSLTLVDDDGNPVARLAVEPDGATTLALGANGEAHAHLRVDTRGAHLTLGDAKRAHVQVWATEQSAQVNLSAGPGNQSGGGQLNLHTEVRPDAVPAISFTDSKGVPTLGVAGGRRSPGVRFYGAEGRDWVTVEVDTERGEMVVERGGIERRIPLP